MRLDVVELPEGPSVPSIVADGGLGRPLRLLIVDDDIGRSARTTAALAGLDLDPHHALSESDALALLKQGGLVTVLIEMDGVRDGAALALAIRRSRPRIPIVFLVDRTGSETTLPQIAGERVDLVIRPFASDWLRARIKGYADLYRHETRLRKLRLESRRARQDKLRSADALRRMERYHALVHGALPVAFYCAPRHGVGRRQFVGDTVGRLTGYGADTFTARPCLWETSIHPEDGERVLAAFAELSPGEALTIDYRWRRHDGEYRYVLDHCSLGAEAEAGEVVGVWLDVTERRTREIDRHHTSQLETVGRLTGGIAHDFNNLLAVTINSLERLQKITHQRGDEAWKRTQDALHAARGCADLTRRLVSLSRRDAMQVSLIDLRERLPVMLDLVQRTLGREIEIELDIPEDISPVSVVPSQFDSAVLNLALNARDAMPEGGLLTVSLSEDKDSLVEVAISDTGTGMPPGVLDKALDPFFTTKEENGTGLGLSMIQDFAHESGGEVRIESRQGEGTTVRLLLPGASPEA